MFSRFLPWKWCSSSLLYFKCNRAHLCRCIHYPTQNCHWLLDFSWRNLITTTILLSSSYVFLTILCSLSLPSLREISSRNQILSRREEERNWGKRKRSEWMNLILKAKTEFLGAISESNFHERMPNAECAGGPNRILIETVKAHFQRPTVSVRFDLPNLGRSLPILDDNINNRSLDESNYEGFMVNSLSWPREGGILMDWRWLSKPIDARTLNSA